MHACVSRSNKNEKKIKMERADYYVEHMYVLLSLPVTGLKLLGQLFPYKYHNTPLPLHKINFHPPACTDLYHNLYIVILRS